MLHTAAVKIEVILYYWGNNNKGKIYKMYVSTEHFCPEYIQYMIGQIHGCKMYGYRWLTVLSLQFCGGWGHLHVACRLFATLLHPNSCILCEFFQSGLDRPLFTLSHWSTWGLNGYMQLLEGDPPGNFQQPQSSTTTITRGKAHSTFRGWSILSRSGLTLLESNCSTEGFFPTVFLTAVGNSAFTISFQDLF